MKKANRNFGYSFDDFQNETPTPIDKNLSDETNMDDESKINYEEDYSEDDNESIDKKDNDYKVIDKNSKFKALIIIVICVALSLSLVIANSVSTHKQIGEKTTVTEETVTSNVTDVITTAPSNQEEQSNAVDEDDEDIHIVEYQLPPDLSVYGTWQVQDNTTLKINYDGSYIYTVDTASEKDVFTGTHALSVCGEKALTQTDLTPNDVKRKFGVPTRTFNVDNFYYIRLPFEYVSYGGEERTTASSDFNDYLAEFYLYLYNDKEGNLKAYNYIPRDGESALITVIDEIKGEGE